MVLTSDYLYQLDRESRNLMELEDKPRFQNLTVASNRDLILVDYYNLEKTSTSIKLMTLIESPVEMDNIEFKEWNNAILEFTCDEFMNWDRHLK